MGAKRKANLHAAIQEGMDSGPAMVADELFAELNARYVNNPPHSTQPRNVRSTEAGGASPPSPLASSSQASRWIWTTRHHRVRQERRRHGGAVLPGRRSPWCARGDPEGTGLCAGAVTGFFSESLSPADHLASRPRFSTRP